MDMLSMRIIIDIAVVFPINKAIFQWEHDVQILCQNKPDIYI